MLYFSLNDLNSLRPEIRNAAVVCFIMNTAVRIITPYGLVGSWPALTGNRNKFSQLKYSRCLMTGNSSKK